MVSMKHLLSFIFSALLFSSFSVAWALVPGPILLSDDQVESLQNDDERQLKLPKTRSKSVCLTAADKRFCTGQSLAQTESQLAGLKAVERRRLLPFYDQNQLKGLLALLPTALRLPPAKIGAVPVSLGPEPVLLERLQAQLSGKPVKMPFAKGFGFSQPPADLTLWYYSEAHLGLVTHTSEQGDYVIGVLIAK